MTVYARAIFSIKNGRFHRLRVDGRPKRIKKFAFSSVWVYNRLRVDGALEELNGDGLECINICWS